MDGATSTADQGGLGARAWATARGGLRLALGGWMALFVLSGATSLYRSHLVRALIHGELDYASRQELFERLELLGNIGGGVRILGAILIAVGLFQLAVVPRQSGARSFARAAAAGWAVSAALQVAYLLGDIAMRGDRPLEWLATAFRYAWICETAVMIVSLTALAFALQRLFHFTGRGAPTGALPAYFATLAAAYGVPLVHFFGGLEIEDALTWTFVLVGLRGVFIAALLWVGVAALRCLGSGDLPAGEGAADTLDPEYRVAAGGLDTYAAGLKARLFVLVGGMSLMMLAQLSHSPEMAKGLVVLISLATLITTGVVIVGVARYAAVPQESGGRETAVTGLVLLGVVAMAEVWALLLVMNLISADASAAMEAAERLPVIAGVGQVVGLFGLLCLLLSFHAVARRVGASQLRGRITSVALLVLVTAAGAGGLRVLVHDRILRGPDVLAVAVLVLGAAVTMLVMYLAILRRLSAAMRSPRAELPRAQLR